MNAQALIQQVTDTLYAPFRYAGSGIPEGVQVSDPGWIYRDTTNDMLWYKQTGTSNTGWKAMGGVIVVDTTQTGNVGTGTDTLQSWTLPAGTLANNGDSIRITVGGVFAENDNSKTVSIKLGGSDVFAYGNTGLNDRDWSLVCTIYRTSASTQKAIGTLVFGIVAYGWADYGTASIDLTDDATILVTGAATDDNDIVKQIFQVELLPAP